MFHSKALSKDHKVCKLKGYVLNSTDTVSNITDNLLNIKNKDLNGDELKKSMTPWIHNCDDTIAVLSHANQGFPNGIDWWGGQFEQNGQKLHEQNLNHQ